MHSGENLVRGLPVTVTRKRIRRINLRIDSDGAVRLSVPKWWATLREGEAFLMSNWEWVLATRAKVLAQASAMRAPTDEERRELSGTIGGLQSEWAARTGELDVTWALREMKTIWGSCHYKSRHIVYNMALARVPRDLVEYVVVHELTHLRAHDHGAGFKSLMDERMPDWRKRRRRLNKRDFACRPPEAPPCRRQLVQGELWEGMFQ